MLRVDGGSAVSLEGASTHPFAVVAVAVAAAAAAVAAAAASVSAG